MAHLERHSPDTNQRSVTLHTALVSVRPWPVVAALAALPLAIAAWLLLSPTVILSREMTWDLLFNLSGAWHLANGSVPHVDFHDPLGSFNFTLTRLGFGIAGPKPFAFLIGQVLVSVAVLLAASWTAAARLPLAAAVVFTAYVTLLTLLPTNVGDAPNAYTFAMSYNRWGWSGLAVLAMLVILPARVPGQSWAPAALGTAILLSLFYVKITFAVAGAALVLAALVLQRPAAWNAWLAGLAFVTANAAAPHSHPYLLDVWHAATSGYARSSLLSQFLGLVGNQFEYAIYAAGLLALWFTARRGWARVTTVMMGFVLLALGMVVLSQNAQTGGLPVGLVILMLLYDALARAADRADVQQARALASLLCVVLVQPLFAVGADLATCLSYARAAMRDEALLAVDRTNLRGLVVPADPVGVDAPIPGAATSVSRYLPNPPITAARYVQTLLEAADHFATRDGEQPRILVLDQVNPLPFMLGFPPPRYGTLWMGPEWLLSADEVFRDADVVLIPKWGTSTNLRATAAILAKYQAHVDRTFPERIDLPSWTIAARPAQSQ